MNYLALISALISAIKSVEMLMPASTGKDKFDAVIATVEGIFGDVTAQLPALTAMVTGIVAAFNAIKQFTHKSA